MLIPEANNSCKKRKCSYLWIKPKTESLTLETQRTLFLYKLKKLDKDIVGTNKGLIEWAKYTLKFIDNTIELDKLEERWYCCKELQREKIDVGRPICPNYTRDPHK